VHAGRFTIFEKDAFNATETYTWSAKDERINIEFSFNKGSLSGDLKSIPQKGWIYNSKSNTHWKVSPFWPLKLDYLVLYVDEKYDWTAVGVPNQKYLWIMSRAKHPTKEALENIISILNTKNYKVSKLTHIKHNPN
jgi:apolipoprotein D and lipocalin family protein